MENNEKKYWKGLEELHATPEFVKLNRNEFAEELPIDELLTESKVNTPTPRRDFLKALGLVWVQLLWQLVTKRQCKRQSLT